MILKCRDKQKAFETLQALLEGKQKAYLTSGKFEEPAIRICHDNPFNFYCYQKEITSPDQLTENEYKIIA
jgi:hypothetical protein